jgi:hypothetical protein
MMLVVGGVVKWKGYIDKARPDNSRGFTALGLLYEMLKKSVARSRRKSWWTFRQESRALMRGCRLPVRERSQPTAKRQQLLPGRHDCSPAIAVTIESSRHTPSSAFSASRRLAKRTSRHFYLPKDTPHTHPPCLPISGEFTPQMTSGGQVEGEGGHYGQGSF